MTIIVRITPTVYPRKALLKYWLFFPLDTSNLNANATKIPGITMSPSPSIENGHAESAVGNKSFIGASRTVVSAADIANEYTLGVLGETFAFSQCNSKVTVAESSALTGDISQLEQFIRDRVKP